jgi:hypothetical protein
MLQDRINSNNIEEFIPYAVNGQIVSSDYSITKCEGDVRHNDGQTYVYNNEGHRGPDFESGIGLLAVGCSVSNGIGLPLENTWAHQLAEKLNVTYNLLSYPAGSISICIRQTIEYIYKYGAPKYLVCLFPNNDRVDEYSMGDMQNYSYSNKKQVEEKIRNISLSSITSEKNVLTEKSRPVNIKYARLHAASQFVILSRFCSLLNIKFLWGTWSDWDNFVSMEYDFMPVDSYIKETHSTVSSIQQDDLVKSNCHSDENDPYFIVGSDEVKHWGTHYHLHVAEHFAQELKTKYAAKI